MVVFFAIADRKSKRGDELMHAMHDLLREIMPSPLAHHFIDAAFKGVGQTIFRVSVTNDVVKKVIVSIRSHSADKPFIIIEEGWCRIDFMGPGIGWSPWHRFTVTSEVEGVLNNMLTIARYVGWEVP